MYEIGQSGVECDTMLGVAQRCDMLFATVGGMKRFGTMFKNDSVRMVDGVEKEMFVVWMVVAK
jgi:hypothetical protein